MRTKEHIERLGLRCHDDKSLWAQELERELLRCKMDGSQVGAITKRYHALAKRVGEKAAFSEMMESFGSTLVPPIIEKIEDALKNHKIEANPVVRIREAIRRHNANLEKYGGVTVDGRDIGAKPEKVKIPEFARDKSFESLAKYGGKVAKLELEIRF